MTSRIESLTAANIKYLLVLHRLDQGKGGVRCTDVAEMLKVSKPSTHKMMNAFKNLGLISKGHYGSVYLTHFGKELACRYYRCYEDAYRHFSWLLPENVDVKSVVYSVFSEITIEEIEKMCAKMNTQETH